MRRTGLNTKRMLVAVLVLASASASRAASVPASESFEGYTNGHPIVSEADWSGAADAGSVTDAADAIAALTTYTNAGGAFPLPSAAHARVLQLSDALTNSVTSAAGGVVISEMLFMPSQRSSAPPGSSNYQFACYVDTNDLPVVWHRGASSNEWITLTNSPALETGVWARVAIHQAYASHRYKVVINDGAAIVDGRGWSAASGGTHPGAWFDMAQTNGYMTQFRTEGGGAAYLDDLVFTKRAVTYDGTNFVEASANDGSIATTQTITLVGDSFVNTPYSAGAHFSTSGVPAGLSVVLAYVSASQVSVTLTGSATAHAAADSASGMGLTLEDAIFTLGNATDVDGDARSDLVVTFDDPPVLSYGSSTFLEAVANNGSIANDITIMLAGDTFTNTSPLLEGAHFTTSGVPAGLSVSVIRNNATELTLSLSGTATLHGDAADTNMTLTFLDAAFEAVAAGNITDSAKSFAIDFADTAELSYSTTTFAETAANDGSINGGTINVSAEAFTGAVGTNYVLGGEVQVSNLPAGLTASIVKTTPNQVTVSFTATADAHTNANDISNLSFAFQNAAFSGGSAAAVTDSARADLVVDFNDAPLVAYSGSTFSEASSNDGTVDTSITLTVSGDVFTDDGDFGEGDEYTVANEPAGLFLSVTRDSATQLTLSLTNTASAHTNANDIGDLTFALQDAAFSTVSAANITGASRNDLAVDFDDQPVITYSGTVFSELSGGEIDNTDPIAIDISGDSFSGANGSDFVAAGKVATNSVPPGLTLVLTKSSSTRLLATLTGTAVAHADPGNDVSNLGITFLDAAFTADADQVTGYSRSDLQVDFNNSTLTINTVPYNETFETYTDGYQLGGSEGWQPGGAGTVTTETAIVSALVASLERYPNTNIHSKVLCLSEETSDEIKSGTGGLCFSDMMFYVTPREAAPTGGTNYQFAMFVDTNQLLNVWHRDTSGTPTNTWELLAGVTVSTSAWHRVTIEKDYAAQKYRLYLGGSVTPVDNPTSGDDWFNMVGTGNAYMSRLRVLGASTTEPLYLDDLRVAETRPRYLIPNASTFLLR